MPTQGPYRDFRFLVEIDGVVAGEFRDLKVQSTQSLDASTQAGTPQPTFQQVPRPSSLGGLTSSTGGGAARKLPGRLKWQDISLDRGITSGASRQGRPGGLSAGSGSEVAKKMPGRLKWQDITLKRPISSAHGAAPGGRLSRPLKGRVMDRATPAASARRALPSPQQARSKSELDSVTQKIQPVVLALGGFVGSGAAIPDRQANQRGKIVLVDPNGTPVATWHFQHAWPSKHSGPTLKSDDSSVGVETVFIAFEKLRRG